jgi:hypothetical protein
MSIPTIPEWGTIFTVKFPPSISLGLELWRVPHRIPTSLKALLPKNKLNESKTTTVDEDDDTSNVLFDIVTVHAVLPGGTADLHLGADIQQGDLLVALNGDSLVGYFRHKDNLKLQSLLHIVGECPTQRALWFFRPSKNKTGALENVRFPIDCAYLSPLLATKWQPPPSITELQSTKANLKPTQRTALLVSASSPPPSSSSSSSTSSTSPKHSATAITAVSSHPEHKGPKGGTHHGSDRRPETAPENIHLLKGAIIKQNLFLPKGDGILLFAEKKLRSILYDIRVSVKTEIQVLSEDDESIEGEEIHEEESVEDGHVVMQKVRTRRVLSFHCRELYHGTPLYGTDVQAEKSELEIMMELRKNPAWHAKVVQATIKMAQTKGTVYGHINQTVKEILLKLMKLENVKGDRRKFELNIRASKPVRKSLKRKVSTKSMGSSNDELSVGAATGADPLASMASITSVDSWDNSSGLSHENSIASLLQTGELGLGSVEEEGKGDGAKDGAEDGAEDGTEDGTGDGAEDGTGDGAEDGAGDGAEDGAEDGTGDGAGDGTGGGIEHKEKKIETPITSVTKFNIIEQFHKNPEMSTLDRPVTAAATAMDDGSKNGSRPISAPARDSNKIGSLEIKISGEKNTDTEKVDDPATNSEIDVEQKEEKKEDERPLSPVIPKNNIPPLQKPGSSGKKKKKRSGNNSRSSPPPSKTPIQHQHLAPIKQSSIDASQSMPNVGTSMSALSALQLDDASLRLQKVDTLRTQQNVTLMQIVEIEKRLEEQRLEMLQSMLLLLLSSLLLLNEWIKK